VNTVQAWQRQTAQCLESGQAVNGVGGASLVLSLTYPGAQSSPHGSAIPTLTITAGGHGPALAYSAAGLPAGLSVNSSTGAVTGTPTTAGLYSPVVTVTDSGTGDSASVQFDWSIT
jgi:hypothetical protein